ncbi:hypothetical protein MP228_008355 [Amoeboaphelidium protococcarum]|nr:hypothetical protein MP228_008355 [Amoeboaphelidium protococcarum]
MPTYFNGVVGFISAQDQLGTPVSKQGSAVSYKYPLMVDGVCATEADIDQPIRLSVWPNDQKLIQIPQLDESYMVSGELHVSDSGIPTVVVERMFRIELMCDYIPMPMVSVFGPIALKQAGVVTTTVDTYVSAAKKTQTFTAKAEFLEQRYGRGLSSASIGSTLVSHGLLRKITKTEINLMQSVVQQIRSTPAASTPMKAGSFWTNKKRRVNSEQTSSPQSVTPPSMQSSTSSSAQQSSSKMVAPSSITDNEVGVSNDQQSSSDSVDAVQNEAIDITSDADSPQNDQVVPLKKATRRQRKGKR